MSDVSRLEQAEWTSLRNLDLGDGVQGTLDKNLVCPLATQGLLHKFGAQLNSVRIACVVSGATDMLPVVGDWPLQTFLALQAAADASVLERLAEGCWPVKVLQLLAPSQVDLVSAMLQLVACNWAVIEQVSLSSLEADLAGDATQIAELLASCDWPLLWKLDLYDNGLTDTFIGPLVHGKWPRLQELDLSENDLQEEGVRHLLQGQWPMLRCFGCMIMHLIGMILKSTWKLCHRHLSLHGQLYFYTCQTGWIRAFRYQAEHMMLWLNYVHLEQ